MKSIMNKNELLNLKWDIETLHNQVKDLESLLTRSHNSNTLAIKALVLKVNKINKSRKRKS